MATAYPGGLRKRGGLLDYEDTIQATPRNPFFGGVAGLLEQSYKQKMPRIGVPGLDLVAANKNLLLDLLGVGDVQKTAEAMSYGGRLGTGAGMTYRPLPETMGAAMTVAPMAAPAARGVSAIARFVAPKAGLLAENYMRGMGMMPAIVEGKSAGIIDRRTTLVNPKTLVFREKFQNRKSDLKVDTDEFDPIVVIDNSGELSILDGHNRASVAKDRGDRLAAVKINQAEYDALKEKGFDDSEIAWATLQRANQSNAASNLNSQFPGSNIARSGNKAWDALIDINEEELRRLQSGPLYAP